MDYELKVNGKNVDLIETFDDLFLVQDIETKSIFLVHYYQFDSDENVGYVLTSNVISFKGWKNGKKKEEKRTNTRFAKYRNTNP
jgi:GTP cyclohydrolase I